MTLKDVTPAGLVKDVNDNFNTIGERGVYTCVAGDDTANEAEIDTGKTDATGFIVQIYRSGVMVMSDAVVTLASGVLTIADGASTYDVTAGDKIHWLVF